MVNQKTISSALGCILPTAESQPQATTVNTSQHDTDASTTEVEFSQTPLSGTDLSSAPLPTTLQLTPSETLEITTSTAFKSTSSAYTSTSQAERAMSIEKWSSVSDATSITTTGKHTATETSISSDEWTTPAETASTYQPGLITTSLVTDIQTESTAAATPPAIAGYTTKHLTPFPSTENTPGVSSETTITRASLSELTTSHDARSLLSDLTVSTSPIATIRSTDPVRPAANRTMKQRCAGASVTKPTDAATVSPITPETETEDREDASVESTLASTLRTSDAYLSSALKEYDLVSLNHHPISVSYSDAVLATSTGINDSIGSHISDVLVTTIGISSTESFPTSTDKDTSSKKPRGVYMFTIKDAN